MRGSCHFYVKRMFATCDECIGKHAVIQSELFSQSAIACEESSLGGIQRRAISSREAGDIYVLRIGTIGVSGDVMFTN